MTVLKELKKLGNKEIALHSQKFFKTGKGEYGEGDIFLGIRVPVLREFAKRNHDLEGKKLDNLIASPFHEARLTGLIILVNQYSKTKDSSEKYRLYKKYIKSFPYINNWDLVDVTCHKIIGSHLFENDRSILYKWAQHKNLWIRRISIISTFYFIKRNELDDSYKLAHILLTDKHDLIHKAVGWVLRECGKKDQKRLKLFLRKKYSSIHRTTLRYAIEKFSETERKKILKGHF
ncbi:DNA alkylation repair protein [Bacteriovoracaceae bacterium]|nr:DNA alkylation repair protein [Bacteriovoracaceae bacterium]